MVTLEWVKKEVITKENKQRKVRNSKRGEVYILKVCVKNKQIHRRKKCY